MRSKFQDSNTLWHDNSNADSNNWQNYTAMAKYLGLSFSRAKLLNYWNECKEEMSSERLMWLRHPGKITPPPSRDCAIGLFCLDLLSYTQFKNNGWKFYGKAGEGIDLEKLFAGAVKLSLVYLLYPKRRRNLFWEFQINELNQIAYRLPPHDVYWIKRCSGRKPEAYECMAWKLYVKVTLGNEDPSAMNLLWLQAKHMRDEKLAKSCNPNIMFDKYFPKDHPFNKTTK